MLSKNCNLIIKIVFSSIMFCSSAYSSTTWTPELMMKTKMVANVEVSPKNNEVVFSVTNSVIENDKVKFVGNIFQKNLLSNELVQVTDNNISCTDPRYSLTGEKLAFICSSAGINNLYLYENNKIHQITNLAKSVESYSFSQSGNTIAFVSEDASVKTDGTGDIDSASYSEVYTANLRHLYTIDLSQIDFPISKVSLSDEAVKGAGDFANSEPWFDFSPDEKAITYAVLPKQNVDTIWKESKLQTVNVTDLKNTAWEQISEHMSVPRYSRDGKWIAFLKANDNTNSDYGLTRYISIKNTSTGEYRQLSKTPDEAPFLAGESILGWNHDSSAVLYYEPYHFGARIYALPIDGSPYTVIDTKDKSVFSPRLSADGKALGFVHQNSHTAPEAYMLDLVSGKMTQISHINSVMAEYKLPDNKVIRWTSSEGVELEAMLTLPINYEKDKGPYPLHLVVHGGPMSCFKDTYLGLRGVHPIAAYADDGVAVLRVNPRGSCGYGRDFRYANFGDLGGGDFRDLMSGVDYLINEGIADSSRLGISGWSYGGYMTAWAITQTNRFKLAGMGAGIANWLSMVNTTDLHRYVQDYFNAQQWYDNTSLILERSPVIHVDKIQTPVLIQHGFDDPRVPYSQGLEMFYALSLLDKSVVMYGYPGMKHSPTTPHAVLDVMQKKVDFFKDL